MLAAEDAPLFVELVAENFDHSSRTFVRALRECLPTLPEDEILWRFHFMLGTIYYSASSPQRIKAFSRGRCDPADIESTVRHLVPFLAAGFRSAAAPAPRRPRAAQGRDEDAAVIRTVPPTPRTSWRTLLGDYPNTHALRSGAVASSRLTLTFDEVAVPNKAFKRVVRDLEFDVAELALMTFLMARSRGVPLRLLPVVVFSRNPLPYLVGNVARGRLTPSTLAGRRIGVRAYTTTTAAWVRAVLTDLYGVDFDRVEWTTFEEGHVAGVADPPSVRRAPAGASLAAMLLDGAVDAAIVDPVPDDPRLAPVVRDPERPTANGSSDGTPSPSITSWSSAIRWRTIPRR